MIDFISLEVIPERWKKRNVIAILEVLQKYLQKPI